uniref:Thioredoxin like 4B n=1 Tax=Lynx canadensis TaxID=61383 RepID=A0A667HUZ4_LYNCA
MSFLLPKLTSKKEVDQAIKSTAEKVLVLRFGRDEDPVCLQLDDILSKTSSDLSKMAAIYLVDVDQTPVYTHYFDISYIPSTVFFFNGQHMKVDYGRLLGTHSKPPTARRPNTQALLPQPLLVYGFCPVPLSWYLQLLVAAESSTSIFCLEILKIPIPACNATESSITSSLMLENFPEISTIKQEVRPPKTPTGSSSRRPSMVPKMPIKLSQGDSQNSVTKKQTLFHFLGLL